MAKPIHVVPHGDGWAWRREDSQRVSGIAETQTGAIKQARPASQRDGVEFVTGRFKTSHFGADQNQPD